MDLFLNETSFYADKYRTIEPPHLILTSSVSYLPESFIKTTFYAWTSEETKSIFLPSNQNTLFRKTAKQQWKSSESLAVV